MPKITKNSSVHSSVKNVDISKLLNPNSNPNINQIQIGGKKNTNTKTNTKTKIKKTNKKHKNDSDHGLDDSDFEDDESDNESVNDNLENGVPDADEADEADDADDADEPDPDEPGVDDDLDADDDLDPDDPDDPDNDNYSEKSDKESNAGDDAEDDATDDKNYIDDEETLKKKCYSKYAKIDIDDLDFDEMFGDEKILIEKNIRISKPVLTKYEFVRLLTDRSKQLSQGAKHMLKNTQELSSKEIAKLEIKEGVIPLIIERPIPNSKSERWKISELQVPEHFFTM